MKKGLILEEEITIVNTYAINIKTTSVYYIKQMWKAIREKKINSNTIIVGDFKIPFSSADRWFREKINKEAY